MLIILFQPFTLYIVNCPVLTVFREGQAWRGVTSGSPSSQNIRSGHHQTYGQVHHREALRQYVEIHFAQGLFHPQETLSKEMFELLSTGSCPIF